MGIKGKLLAGLAITSLVAGAASLAAAHGGDTDKVHACVSKLTGAVRIVGASSGCLLLENPVDWNVAGPAGPPGPPGPPGPQGATGLLGLYRVEVEFTAPGQPSGTEGGIALCDPGDVVTGGGFSSNVFFENTLRLTESAPFSVDNGPEGWRVLVVNPTSNDLGVTVYAICADLGT